MRKVLGLLLKLGQVIFVVALGYGYYLLVEATLPFIVVIDSLIYYYQSMGDMEKASGFHFVYHGYFLTFMFIISLLFFGFFASVQMVWGKKVEKIQTKKVVMIEVVRYLTIYMEIMIVLHWFQYRSELIPIYAIAPPIIAYLSYLLVKGIKKIVKIDNPTIKTEKRLKTITVLLALVSIGLTTFTVKEVYTHKEYFKLPQELTLTPETKGKYDFQLCRIYLNSINCHIDYFLDEYEMTEASVEVSEETYNLLKDLDFQIIFYPTKYTKITVFSNDIDFLPNENDGYTMNVALSGRSYELEEKEYFALVSFKEENGEDLPIKLVISSFDLTFSKS